MKADPLEILGSLLQPIALDPDTPVWRLRQDVPRRGMFDEAVFLRVVGDEAADPADLIAQLREIQNSLPAVGLYPASFKARNWFREGHLSYFALEECVFEAQTPLELRSAVTEYSVLGGLYVDGILVAVIDAADEWRTASRRLLDLQERCPQDLLTALLFVAVGQDGCAIAPLGASDAQWRRVSHRELPYLLDPIRLVRVGFYDVDESASRGTAPELPLPAVLRACESCEERLVEERASGLVSVAVGGGLLSLVRGVTRRLEDQSIKPVVLAPRRSLQEKLSAALGAPIGRDMRTTFADNAHTIVTSPARIAEYCEMTYEGPPAAWAIIAVGVDAGFRGAQALAIRLWLPHTPWLSLTTLPPAATPPGVLHAFANMDDDEGFLAVLTQLKDPVPLDVQPFMDRQGPEDNDLFGAGMNEIAGLISADLRNSESRTVLVLVEDGASADSLASALSRYSIAHINACRWGQAHAGWDALNRATGRTVVIRTSLPFWAWIPQLDAAFVFRNIGRTTCARLDSMLKCRAPGKSAARFILPPHVFERDYQRGYDQTRLRGVFGEQW